MSTPKKVQRTPSASKPSSAAKILGFDEVQSLISLVAKEGLSDFEYEAPNVRLRIRKELGQIAAPVTVAAPVIPQVIVAAPAPQAASSPAPTAAPAAQDEPGVHYITSPIVGTFYRASNPNSAPFVQVGDFVKAGQTLCIVEAMKLMNEIECDVAGEVLKVLVENGQPVEYGERLYAIRLG